MRGNLKFIVFLLFNLFFISLVNSGAPIPPTTDDIVDCSNTIVIPKSNVPLFSSCGLDIIFVIDVSESIDNNDFNEMVSILNNIVDSLLPGTDSKMSVIMFASNAFIQIENSDNVNDIKNAISSRINLGVETDFQEALSRVQDISDLRPDI